MVFFCIPNRARTWRDRRRSAQREAYRCQPLASSGPPPTARIFATGRSSGRRASHPLSGWFPPFLRPNRSPGSWRSSLEAYSRLVSGAGTKPGTRRSGLKRTLPRGSREPVRSSSSRKRSSVPDDRVSCRFSRMRSGGQAIGACCRVDSRAGLGRSDLRMLLRPTKPLSLSKDGPSFAITGPSFGIRVRKIPKVGSSGRPGLWSRSHLWNFESSARFWCSIRLP